MVSILVNKLLEEPYYKRSKTQIPNLNQPYSITVFDQNLIPFICIGFMYLSLKSILS